MHLSTLDSFFIQPIEVLEDSSQAKQFQSICIQHAMTCAFTHWKIISPVYLSVLSCTLHIYFFHYLTIPEYNEQLLFQEILKWFVNTSAALGVGTPYNYQKFPLIRITEVASTCVSFMLGACWNMISMISLCKLVVRPVAGPDQLRLLAQCWKHKLFSVNQWFVG